MKPNRKPLIEQENHNLNVFSNGLLRSIEDQEMINAKIQFYGGLYEEKIPKEWFIK